MTSLISKLALAGFLAVTASATTACVPYFEGQNTEYGLRQPIDENQRKAVRINLPNEWKDGTYDGRWVTFEDYFTIKDESGNGISFCPAREAGQIWGEKKEMVFRKLYSLEEDPTVSGMRIKELVLPKRKMKARANGQIIEETLSDPREYLESFLKLRVELSPGEFYWVIPVEDEKRDKKESEYLNFIFIKDFGENRAKVTRLPRSENGDIEILGKAFRPKLKK